MFNEVICNLNLFDANQKIYIYKNNMYEIIGETNLNSIAEDMLTIGQEHDISRFHIFGNNDYVDKLVEDLKFLNYSKFNNNEIEIEVN